jgi:hypothetical protein
MHDPAPQLVVPGSFARIGVCCQCGRIGVMTREAVRSGLVSGAMEFRVEYGGFLPEGPLHLQCDHFAFPVRKRFREHICDPRLYWMTTGRLLVSQ